MKLIDTELAALILGVTERRVRQMVTEGKITNHGHSAQRFEYDLEAISRLAAQKQRRDLTN